MEEKTAHLGKISNTPISASDLDLVKWTGGEILVHFDCSEFSSHCPVTSQPDFGRIEISYIPNGKLIETKSLKLYLWSFRNLRKFNEGIVDTICSQIYEQAQPKWCEVLGNFNPRGGISLTARAERGKRPF